MSTLKEFLDIATREEVALLAESCETTAEYLWQLSINYGGRRPRIGLAVCIETHTRGLRKVNRSLPLVTCEDLAGPVE